MGIHKQVSVMLNIKFTLSGGGGLARDIWHMTERRRIHSQELLLVVLPCLSCLLQVYYMTRIDNLSLRQYRACVVDSLGMGIICMSYIAVLCVNGIPILIFIPSLYSNFYIYAHDLLVMT